MAVSNLPVKNVTILKTAWMSFKPTLELEFAHWPAGGDLSPIITAVTSYLAVLDTIEVLYNAI